MIDLALEGNFQLIAHGCNCFNTFGSGIAKEVRERLPEVYEADRKTIKGDISKLGNITYYDYDKFTVLNCYIQYGTSCTTPQIDYEALTLCMRKINQQYPGRSIGLPLIGCGLAGGNWFIVEKMLKEELKDMDVTIVRFNK